MTKKRLIVGNWKMNATIEETLKLITELSHKLPPNATDVVIAPPFTSLYSAHVALQDTPIKLAGQNMHWETDGAYTGEISGVFLKDVGCEYVLLGHSERRQYFGETDEKLSPKIQAALTQELTPILCIGETKDQKTAGKTHEVLGKQLKRSLQDTPMSDARNLVVAYEPVWAIGSGHTPTTQEIEGAHHFIRDFLGKTYDQPTANEIRILYGGSVSPDNARSLLSVSQVEGLLVGGASLIIDKFLKIIAASREAG